MTSCCHQRICFIDSNQCFRRLFSLFLILIPVALSSCQNHAASGQSKLASAGGSVSKAEALAANKERAEYWRGRGYDFDYRDTTAAQMDLFASVWSPSGWNEFKASAEQMLSDNAKKSISPQREPQADETTRNGFAAPAQSPAPQAPALIVPKAKPLPVIGP